MLKINIEELGDLAIIECEGRIVQSADTFKLRDAVLSHSEARTIVLVLSEVGAIEGGGLGMLMFLQRWAQNHSIRFKLFNPSKSVRDRLDRAGSMAEFEIATIDEMTALVERGERQLSLAA